MQKNTQILWTKNKKIKLKKNNEKEEANEEELQFYNVLLVLQYIALGKLRSVIDTFQVYIVISSSFSCLNHIYIYVLLCARALMQVYFLNAMNWTVALELKMRTIVVVFFCCVFSFFFLIKVLDPNKFDCIRKVHRIYSRIDAKEWDLITLLLALHFLRIEEVHFYLFWFLWNGSCSRIYCAEDEKKKRELKTTINMNPLRSKFMACDLVNRLHRSQTFLSV